MGQSAAGSDPFFRTVDGEAPESLAPHDTGQETRSLRAQEQELLEQLRTTAKRIADLKGAAPALPASEGPRNATAVIDPGRCARCGRCVELCPEQAIVMNGEVLIEAGKCTGCGLCIASCPNEAITLAGSADRASS